MKVNLFILFTLVLIKLEKDIVVGQICKCTGSECQTQCTAGTFFEGSGLGCTTCPSGYYCDGSSGGPKTPCPAGKYFSGTGATSTTDCSNCATNSFSAAGSAACTLCPAGYSCANTSQTACSNGEYSLEGETLCTSCPTGKVCSSTTTAPQNCNAGEEPNGAQSGCTSCSSGSFSTDGTTCTTCPKGYKCPIHGMISPTECPDGEFQTSTGQTSCLQCSAGKDCSNKTMETDCVTRTLSTSTSRSNPYTNNAADCGGHTIATLIGATIGSGLVGFAVGVVIMLAINISRQRKRNEKQKQTVVGRENISAPNEDNTNDNAYQCDSSVTYETITSSDERVYSHITSS